MITISTTTIVFAVAFFVVAAIAAGLSIAGLTSFLASNRKIRLARRESVRSYYGGLVLHH